MAKRTRRKRPQRKRLTLPTERRAPEGDPWRYAYLLTGEKKIGKTTFAIEGAEELVIQFDKPQIAYELREVCPTSWREFEDVLKEIEALAEDPSTFPYNRIVVDGAGEWYTMCQAHVCKHFGVEHPSDEGYARAWHKLRDDFTDAVNRLLRLQERVDCGVVFISHSEWKEKKQRDGSKIERLVPNLPPRCEEILNGKVDGWFTFDYAGEERIMVIVGDEVTGAGHRIDGHFMTAGGERVREIYMGGSAEDALANFMEAFNNEAEYATWKERRAAQRKASAGKRTSRKKGRRTRRAGQ